MHQPQTDNTTTMMRTTTIITMIMTMTLTMMNVILVILPITIAAQQTATGSNTEVYGSQGQSVAFSWTLDCGLLGHATIATFRILAKIDNVTIDNDEYAMHYDENWDVTTGNTTSTTATTTPGGYKIGQKKVVQFHHTYTDARSYGATLTATIIAPDHPSIHLVQHTANYTMAISDVLCFTTTGLANSNNDTNPNDTNIFSLRDNADDDWVRPPPLTNIEVQNASMTDTTSSSTLSFRMIQLDRASLVRIVSMLLTCIALIV